jgi:uncharacterized protein
MPSDEGLAELFAIVELARRTAPLVHSAIHGEQHWQCVARIGSRLAATTSGADLRIALLFAVLHDCRRENEGYDPDHGHRAAEFVDELAAKGRLTLDSDRRCRLRDAVARHNDGETTLDPATGVCWDADRLCLPRVGVEPWDELLSTDAGRGARRWALTVIYEPLGEWRAFLTSSATGSSASA